MIKNITISPEEKRAFRQFSKDYCEYIKSNITIMEYYDNIFYHRYYILPKDIIENKF